ncbi:hypothetical protein [Sphingomonas soli]|uniref:hypothetical protein n=1 Tax=Sphingomonas soli TaxID=266127 RepID=UPI000A9AE9A0|nr:hypothetical protein [Sphingomonas soli]
MARLIAAKLDYPTSRDDPFVPGGIKAVSLSDAAYVLAVAATTSLAHHSAPKPHAVSEAKQALAELRDRPVWLANGWMPGQTNTWWMPLTGATFDCGIIGWDAQNAFIFWAEEVD